MASTISRLLCPLRWETLQATLTSLTGRTVELEKGCQYEIEVLWSGSAGTAIPLALTRAIRPGEKLFIQHSDAARWTSLTAGVKSVAPGQAIYFISGPPTGGGVVSGMTIGATPDILNISSLTNGFGVSSINALRIVKK